MRQVHFDSLRVTVSGYIKRIREGDPEACSTEWFLLKYLKRIEKRPNLPTGQDRSKGLFNPWSDFMWIISMKNLI